MDIKLMPEKYKQKEDLSPEPKLSPTKISKKISAKANLWLFLSLIILGIALGISLGLWRYKVGLTNEKETQAERIASLSQERDLEMEENFIELKEKIDDFKNALKTHIYPSYLFKMLEELTLPQVRFVDFETDLSQTKISLVVEAISYNSLAKQIVVFEEDSRIKKVELSEVNLEDFGGVKSDLDIEISPDFLRPE